jgi:hypothetical protein
MFSTMKRRIGVFTAIAVMAALVPALSTSSVSAAPLATAAAPTNSSTYSACPSSASTASAGFTDTTSTDVDCIASYGITTGVTATTYEPSSNIPRWQMALYLTRTMDVVGQTLGTGADQSFTDIGGYSAAIQTAINQLAQSGVTLGTTATTYSPDDNVTREQMAMFVERLLGKTAVGPNGAAVSSAAALTTNVGTLETQNAYNYTDIDGAGITFEGHEAIEELYNLGVPGHDKTVTTFGPAVAITRAEMATWLTNAMGHSNARPAGLTIEYGPLKSGFANDPTVNIAYRDANFDGVAGQAVDLFTWTTSATLGNTSPWLADGTCKLNSNVALLGSSLTKCQIDVGDQTTNSLGNIALAAGATTPGVAPVNVYAWTGTAGTGYDNDLHSASLASDAATSTTAAAVLLVSCDANALAMNTTSGGGLTDVARVHHGSTITVTAQMASSINGGISYSNVPQALNLVTFTHTVFAPNTDNSITSVTSNAVYTDAAGTATYSFTQADPNTDLDASDGVVDEPLDDVIHKIVVSDASASTTLASAAANSKPCRLDATAMHFDFSDDYTDVAWKMTLAQSTPSFKAAATALTPIGRSALATVTDTFGDAVSGATVQFHGGTPRAFAVTVTASNVMELAGQTLGLVDNQAVCFLAIAGVSALVTELTNAIGIDTVAYIESIAENGSNTDITLSATAVAGVAGAAVTLANGSAPTAVMRLTPAHPTMGCASRTTGYDGTASVAWNDTTTTAGIDTVVSTATISPGAADNADGTADETEATAATAVRWLAPNATALLSGASCAYCYTATWHSSGDGTQSANGEIEGTPLIHDPVNNTLLIALEYFSGALATTYTQYSYDSNDYFFLASSLGLNGVPTTEAGFEGVAWTTALGATSLGLANHLVDGGGLAYTQGDIDAVSYQALAGNVSSFSLGGN